MEASSSRRGMKRRRWFSGSRKRIVPDSNPGAPGSHPNAWADMQSTSTRECSSPASIFAGMLSPGRISHSSNHTRSPSPRSRSATSRTTAVSFVLWLRNTSYWKC